MDNLGRDMERAFYALIAIVAVVSALAGYGLHALVKRLTS